MLMERNDKFPLTARQKSSRLLAFEQKQDVF